MYIAVYIENGELICYRNIDRFANFTGVKDIYLFEGAEKLTEMVRNNTGFRNISRICLTNGMYPVWNGIATDNEALNEIQEYEQCLSLCRIIQWDCVS